MKEHPSPEALSGFARGGLTAPELLALDDHLASCAECREFVGKMKQPQAGRRWKEALSFEAEEHVAYDVLARHVDGELRDEERIEVTEHLDLCPRCLDEWVDLAELRASMQAPHGWVRRPLWIAWASAAAAIVVGIMIAIPRPAPPARRNTGAAVPKKSIAPAEVSKPQPVIKDGNVNWRVVEGEIEGLTPAEQRIAASLARGAQPASELLALLGSGRRSLRGSAEAPGVVLDAPVGVVLDDDRPSFRWRSSAPGSTFVVEVYDEDFRLVVQSDPITTLNWSPSRPLERGHVYS